MIDPNTEGEPQHKRKTLKKTSKNRKSQVVNRASLPSRLVNRSFGRHHTNNLCKLPRKSHERDIHWQHSNHSHNNCRNTILHLSKYSPSFFQNSHLMHPQTSTPPCGSYQSLNMTKSYGGNYH